MTELLAKEVTQLGSRPQKAQVQKRARREDSPPRSILEGNTQDNPKEAEEEEREEEK